MYVELRIAVLLAVVTLIFGQNNIERNAQNNALLTLTPTPLEIMCNHTETCQQDDNIYVAKYKDLRTRKCMCDEKCSTYGDCCEDSEYYKMTAQLKGSFACEKTLLDGPIYMINKCAPGYANPTMIKYCENPSPVDLVENFLTGIAVAIVRVEKNITYKNAYCAICNYETEFEFWNRKLYFKLAEPDFDIVLKNTSKLFFPDKNSYSVAIHSPEQVLSNMTMNENHTQLVSVVDGTLYLCYIVPKLLINHIPAIRYCRPNSNLRLCSDCERNIPTNSCTAKSNVNTKNTLTLSWDEPKLPIVYTCDDVPDDVYERTKFCEANIDQCFVRNDAEELCLVNSHFDPHEYKLNTDGSIYIEKYQVTFPRWDYLNTTAPGVIYICGPTIPRSDEYKSFIKLQLISATILSNLSIFFLIIYLAINANTNKLQSLPNKIFFSFCSTLLLYAVFEISLLLKSCKIASAVLHYLSLSCIMWLLIASYDFWWVICISSAKLQALDGKTHLKRYLLYCFFGWISPCFIMAVAIYFELALNRIIPCNLKPSYGRLNQCFISQADPKLYFFIYPVSAAFFISMALFTRCSCHIYFNKNAKSDVQRNYYSLFLKLGLSLSITWATVLLVTYVNSIIMDTIFVIWNSSHGILMFFTYGYKRTTLTEVYETYKNTRNFIVQHTRSTYSSISKTFQNPAPQSTASADSTAHEMEPINRMQASSTMN